MILANGCLKEPAGLSADCVWYPIGSLEESNDKINNKNRLDLKRFLNTQTFTLNHKSGKTMTMIMTSCDHMISVTEG